MGRRTKAELKKIESEIVEVLDDEPGLLVEEVMEMVNGCHDRDLSRASVYNRLKKMIDAGKVHRKKDTSSGKGRNPYIYFAGPSKKEIVEKLSSNKKRKKNSFTSEPIERRDDSEIDSPLTFFEGRTRFLRRFRRSKRDAEEIYEELQEKHVEGDLSHALEMAWETYLNTKRD